MESAADLTIRITSDDIVVELTSPAASARAPLAASPAR
jgi:hypothetical protein